MEGFANFDVGHKIFFPLMNLASWCFFLIILLASLRARERGNVALIRHNLPRKSRQRLYSTLLEEDNILFNNLEHGKTKCDLMLCQKLFSTFMHIAMQKVKLIALNNA